VIVLDTNLVSEMMRPAPSRRVADWLAAQPASRLFVTTISQAEVLFGVALLPPGRRRDALARQAEATFEEDFAGRLLPFGQDAARQYPGIVVQRRRNGRPISTLDAQIASIALSHGATLATRNIRDFEDCGVALFNPWDD
jgi:hypothetical protein